MSTPHRRDRLGICQNRADAEAELRHVRRAYPDTSFRLAAAEISEWREVQP